MINTRKKATKIIKLLKKIQQSEEEVKELVQTQIITQEISDQQFWQFPVYIAYNIEQRNNQLKQLQQIQLNQESCQKKITFDQNNQFYCSRCDKQFHSTNRALFHKIKMHNDTSDIKLCQYCNNSYYSHFRLLMHQFKNHSDKMNQAIK